MKKVEPANDDAGEEPSQAEFSPDQIKRFATLTRELIKKHGTARELVKLLPVGESAISRLKKGHGGLSAGTALKLTDLAEIEYAPFALDGRRVPRTKSDVRELASFKREFSEMQRMKRNLDVLDQATDVLSAARPRSVSFALLDHACALVHMAIRAPAEATQIEGVPAERELAARMLDSTKTEQPQARKTGGKK